MNSINEQERIVPRVLLSAGEFKEIESRYDLTFGAPKNLGEGKIATNISVEVEGGRKVIIRAYPITYSVGRIQFEIESLLFLMAHSFNSPRLLRCAEQDYCAGYAIKADDKVIFLYEQLEGETIKQQDLGTDIAFKVGTAVQSFLQITEKFVPSNSSAYGDVAFVQGLFRTITEREVLFRGCPVTELIGELLFAAELHQTYNKMPTGLVHGDLFFENVLLHRGEVSGIIDFGDAYFGSIITDLMVGAMEFSVKAGAEESQTKKSVPEWDLNNFQAFLAASLDWLQSKQITARDCLAVLKVNCARFAIYTLPLVIDHVRLIEDNQYIQRLMQLSQGGLKDELLDIFASAGLAE